MDSAAVPLASPSAFPALPLHPHPHKHTDQHTDTSATTADAQAQVPAPAPAASLSYARASKTNLPPTSAPEGISLPPKPQPPKPNSAHPHPHPNGNGNGNGNGSTPASRPHARKPPPPPAGGRKPRRLSHSTTTTIPDAAAAAAAATTKRPRTVPGMPASMLPPPVANKKAKHKPSQQLHPTPSSASASAPTATVIPTVGKKRRQTLRKTLPPTASKLSALAASFDFVPRDPAAAAAAPSPLSPPPPSSAATSSQKEEEKEEQEEQEAAAIRRETVVSAGAQGDEFRSESLTAADARGAAEADSGAAPALQAASADRKSASAEPAPEPVTAASSAVTDANANASLEVVEDQQQQSLRGDPSLVGFLPEAFVAADGEFAPLNLPPPPPPPATSTDAAADAEETAPLQAHEGDGVQVTKIPGAVQASPVADLSWREKKGWWSPNPDTDGRSASTTPPPPPATTTTASSSSPSATDSADPTSVGPAAVGPAQSQRADAEESILLRFPPWKPAAATAAEAEDRRPAKEVVATEGGGAAAVAVKPLAEFLPRAFVQPEDEEDVQRGEQATVPTTNATATAGAADDTGSSAAALSSFLSGSFAATGPPTPLESPVTVSLPAGDEQREVPVNAEAIVAEPEPAPEPAPTAPLSHGVGVDAIGEGKPVTKESTHSPTEGNEKKKKRHGWWSPGYVPPSTTSAAAAAAGDLVDEKLVQETVGSAGAQGDEFRARSYSHADRVGVAQLEPTPAGSQSASASASATAPVAAPGKSNEEAAARPVEQGQVRRGDDAEPERSGTPIGQFLGQAFSTGRTTAASKEETDETETNDSRPASDSSSSSTTTPRASTSTETAVAHAAAPPPPAAAPSRRRSSSSSSSSSSSFSSASGEPAHHAADEAPSLTLAIASAWHSAPWSRKLWAVLASVAINVGLPFINGVMLGFGELFARNVLGVRLGWPVASSSSNQSQASRQRANTGSVGLRAAGTNANVGTEVPGHAGAKTAAEAVVEGARELSE